jgi:hypothetical protein
VAARGRRFLPLCGERTPRFHHLRIFDLRWGIFLSSSVPMQAWTRPSHILKAMPKGTVHKRELLSIVRSCFPVHIERNSRIARCKGAVQASDADLFAAASQGEEVPEQERSIALPVLEAASDPHALP